MSPTDDLTPLLLPPPDNTGVRYGQGKLLAWNPTTFENEVLWRGSTLTNLDVLAGPAASNFTPGITLALIGWAPGGGASSWSILGQWVTPGTAAAPDLIRRFSRKILAESIAIDVVPDTCSSIASTYGDPGSGDPGPSVTVDILSGTMLVGMTARMSLPAFSDDGRWGLMSFEISGATNVAPDDLRALSHFFFTESTELFSSGIGMSTLHVATGLNVGEHTVTAKYRSQDVLGAATNVVFSERHMTVIAL
jgi:hypothetical protein